MTDARRDELAVDLIRVLARYYDLRPSEIGEAMGMAVAALRHEDIRVAALSIPVQP